MKNIKEEFPFASKGVYANTASCGLLPKGLMDWRREYDLSCFNDGGVGRSMDLVQLILETKREVARFFNGKAYNVALTPNFSLGLNLLLNGMDLGHRVLLLEDDYPSVNWPFDQMGFVVHYAKTGEYLEESIYKRIKSDNISILALSVVQWLNGVLIDLEFLKDLKREFPDLLIIADGTQFLGSVDLDFEASAFDVLGTSAYKWLLSGYGNGFFLFKDRAKKYFKPKSIGFNSVNGDLSRKGEIEFANRLEPGHLDPFNFGSLKFSLRVLRRYGIQNIAAKNQLLKEKAMREFDELGLLEELVMRRNDHGNIFNVRLGDNHYRHLANNGIICSQRGGGIRLSFHFYNSENDIDAIVNVLKTML